MRPSVKAAVLAAATAIAAIGCNSASTPTPVVLPSSSPAASAPASAPASSAPASSAPASSALPSSSPAVVSASPSP